MIKGLESAQIARILQGAVENLVGGIRQRLAAGSSFLFVRFSRNVSKGPILTRFQCRSLLLAAVCACTLLAVVGQFPALCSATIFDDIGYTSLKTELGASMPTGAGIGVSQVEVGMNAYVPDTALTSEFGGKTFALKSGASIPSSHATTVAADFYGNQSGIASGITSVNLWYSDHWLSNGLLRAGTTGTPLAETKKVINASFVYSTTGYTATDIDALRRLDYVINKNKVVAVVAANNGSTTTLPNLLMQGYNSISVGLTSGRHSAGYTSIDGAGRVKPDIVVPATATSWATPVVSGTAALLLQQATTSGMTDALNPEVIKSILMGGATTTQLPGWSRTPTQPLDLVYGAGQLSVDRSYHILTAGEQHASSSSAVPARGWDYATTLAAGNNVYFIDVPANTALSEFSALLTWNRVITDVDPTPAFNAQPSLANLNLKLYTADGFTIGSLIDSSTSTVDNVQRVSFSSATNSLKAGRYALEVSSASPNTSYGLAWTNTSFFVGDLNGDSVVNNFDIDLFQVLLFNATSFHQQHPEITNYMARGDINLDGRIDNFDLTPFADLLSNSSSAPVPEPSTFALLLLGALGVRCGRLRRFRATI